MSYTTGTTHYNLPQTVGSDKRDWTDTNEAFSDVDAALWEAHQGATQAALDIASINSEIQTITGKQADDEADIVTLSGKVSTLETTVGNHTTEIGDVRRDLQDNIESSREDTATSTHAYEIGDYFYYNDVLFKATAQIAIGATIVPNTNCTGVTVMSEMAAGGSSPDASQVSYDNTTSGLTADDVQEAIDEVASLISSDIDYSTTERKIGKWIDDSDLYEKTVSLGTLPSTSGTSTVAHNIANLGKVVDIKGYALGNGFSVTGNSIPLPLAAPNTADCVGLFVSSTNIHIIVGSDFSGYTEAYVTLRYTKSA